MVYLPPVFTETRPEILVAHIERHDFALIVSHGRHGLVASHIPFLVEHRGPDLHLLGHLARPNPQLADLADLPAGGEVMTVFSGPHAYVSPRWYASGPAVPTWNYADVYAYGTVRVIDDAAWLRDFLHRLSQRHEAGSETPWRIEDQPADYMAGMVKGIVGIEIAVTRLEGKFKLSQNRPAADRPQIVAALEARGDAEAGAVARLMREREPG
ncbi:MAG: FMN-binding negative transcriptional regulator [Stellaceae bacterium]